MDNNDWIKKWREENPHLFKEDEPHVDRDLMCPFCGHNFIEVIDENDGYGRHRVSFECDTEFNEDKTMVLGCGRSVELYEDSVEECKADYRELMMNAAMTLKRLTFGEGNEGNS